MGVDGIGTGDAGAGGWHGTEVAITGGRCDNGVAVVAVGSFLEAAKLHGIGESCVIEGISVL